MAKKTQKKTGKKMQKRVRSDKDGRTARGEFRRKLWGHAAEVLSHTEVPMVLLGPAPEGADWTEAQHAKMATEWNALVSAVHLRSKKRE